MMRPVRPELVIFDCDGVLVDSERISVRIEAELLAALGWPLAEAEIVSRFMGRSQSYMVGEIEARLGRAAAADFGRDVERLYREAFESELRPVAGIVEALDAIEAPTCVASSGSHEKMRHTLGLTGLLARFDGRMFSAREVANGKPAPDLFLHAAERLGFAPAACVVVEDSAWGVRGARAAGMRALGFAGGLTAAPSLEVEGALAFDDMRELPRLLAAL
ncbi:MAG: HAD-IA family hydrolase [Solirubrobacterales bacterium]|nr:HAD-IA family hydrolase [Solirubrobacterales bacterium]